MAYSLLIRDGLISEDIIEAALASVLPPTSYHWRRGSESGEGENRVGRSGPTFLNLGPDHPAMEFMDKAMRDTMSRYYINPRPDRSYAGLFQMMPGDMLSPHRDHTVTRKRGFRRRVNLILFLNDPSGGDFQLWDETGLTESVQAVRGRLVMFDARAWHGVAPVQSRRLTLATSLMSKESTADEPAIEHMEWLADAEVNPWLTSDEPAS